MRFTFLAAFFLACTFASAQETPTPTPTPPARLVRLHFAVPPLEGTISLGIYDPAGKLVRVLHREDTLEDFTEGHDALETTWDGNDDAGHPLPAGRYHARGFRVGEEVKIEGIDSFFNDWVTDEDSPHIARISQIAMRDRALQLTATAADGGTLNLLFDPTTEKLVPTDPSSPTASEPGKPAGPLIDPVATARGKDQTVWAITHVSKDSPELQVVQTPADAPTTILRLLAIPADAPQPVGIAAALDADRIYLVEESPTLQRVRSLTLLATAAGQEGAVSDWTIDFDKEIVAHKSFTLENGRPVAVPNESAVAAPVTLPQKLQPNPLERDQPGKVTLAVGFDGDGSFLKTADGLPLRTISDTPHLTRVLLVRRAENAVDVFQDDGAVVEQFRISHLEQMLAFDCGEFELQ